MGWVFFRVVDCFLLFWGFVLLAFFGFGFFCCVIPTFVYCPHPSFHPSAPCLPFFLLRIKKLFTASSSTPKPSVDLLDDVVGQFTCRGSLFNRSILPPSRGTCTPHPPPAATFNFDVFQFPWKDSSPGIRFSFFFFFMFNSFSCVFLLGVSRLNFVSYFFSLFFSLRGFFFPVSYSDRGKCHAGPRFSFQQLRPLPGSCLSFPWLLIVASCYASFCSWIVSPINFVAEVGGPT